jgi:3-oxoacyl-[acyl-carrier-protein] synthase II
MTSIPQRKVVITGLGIMTPCGIGVDQFQANILGGNSGISRLTLHIGEVTPGNIGGEILEFNEETAKKKYLNPQKKSIKVMCREIQLGVSSANLAIEDSKLDIKNIERDRLGVEFGANLMLSPPSNLQDGCFACATDIPPGAGDRFNMSHWGKDGLAKMEPLWLLKYLPNMPACHIGIYVDARGPNNSLTLDEASANMAIGEATRIIERDAADVMICGATGSRINPNKIVHARMWDQLGKMKSTPTDASRPFELHRSGQVVSEGACTFILEEESHAQNRGATIYARILATGSGTAFHSPLIPDNEKALTLAMKSVFRQTGLKPQDIGSINAHGLSDTSTDIAEAKAIHNIFGDLTDKIPVTALKSLLGNSGASCGAQEISASILALRQGFIPATLNYETPDPACKLNIVSGANLASKNKIFLNLNVSRMGQASAAIIEVL